LPSAQNLGLYLSVNAPLNLDIQRLVFFQNGIVVKELLIILADNIQENGKMTGSMVRELLSMEKETGKVKNT
jgi:hypothetical protein